eukprot:scaffold195684_cov30-Tisochrysis_lutea.AAC.1
MFAAKKIVKEKDAQPEPFEMDVAQALCDLEANSNDLKAELRELYIVAAKEVDVTGRKAVVIFVPYKLLKVVHKIQSRLVREVRELWAKHAPRVACPVVYARPHPRGCCVAAAGWCAHRVSVLSLLQLEKKFSGKHVVIIGQRRIMRKPSAGQRQPKQKRPRSRTLTAVHEAVLEDLVRSLQATALARRTICMSLLMGCGRGPLRWARRANRAECSPMCHHPRCTRLRLSASTRAIGGSERRVQGRHLLHRLQEAHRQGGQVRVPCHPGLSITVVKRLAHSAVRPQRAFSPLGAALVCNANGRGAGARRRCAWRTGWGCRRSGVACGEPPARPLASVCGGWDGACGHAGAHNTAT